LYFHYIVITQQYTLVWYTIPAFQLSCYVNGFFKHRPLNICREKNHTQSRNKKYRFSKKYALYKD